jgi:hypothetical protein
VRFCSVYSVPMCVNSCKKKYESKPTYPNPNRMTAIPKYQLNNDVFWISFIPGLLFPFGVHLLVVIRLCFFLISRFLRYDLCLSISVFLMFFIKESRISKSNCARPPQPKGWGMLRAARFRLTGFQKHPNLRFPGSAHQNNCVLCARLHDTLLINLMIHEIPARVHFLPDLKVGVSVTLCTPFVMIIDLLQTRSC